MPPPAYLVSIFVEPSVESSSAIHCISTISSARVRRISSVYEITLIFTGPAAGEKGCSAAADGGGATR